jgi:hypothetical protein
MSTPTPRTDAAQFWDRSDYHDPSAFDWFVRAEHARELERELAELISVNATGAARLAHATAQLAAEREKVRALRLACERIVEQWDKNHDAAPFHAGNVMYSRASFALAATEDAQ